MEDKVYNILERFVINNNFKIIPEDLKLQLISNPSFPSAKSIIDTLDYFGIENIAANVSKDTLDQLPVCFIAILETNTSKSIALVLRKKNNIKLFKEDGTKKTVTIDGFKSAWNGTIIVIEKGVEEIKNHQIYFKNPLVPLSIIGVIAIVFSLVNVGLLGAFYAILTTIGCCLSYFIVKENLGLQNESTSKICNSAANNTSCSEVINSTSSTLLNRFSLSDMSITFFVAILLTISLFGYNPTFFFGLAILSIPITLYSVYAQAIIIKKWCPLCLGIGSILLTHAIIAIISFNAFEFNTAYLIKSISIFAACYLLWTYTKNILKKALQFEQTQKDFLKFKRNDNLFNTLLQKEKLPSNQKISSENSILFGNLNAPLVITSITNPICEFCAKVFEGYDTLLKTQGDKFRLNIVFNVPSDNLEYESSQISQKIIELYKENSSEAYTALKGWFQIKDIDTWQLKYGIPNNDTSLETLQQHTKWCTINRIIYIPATFIGVYKFPKEYEINDLSLFMDSLIEDQNKSIEIKESSIE